MLKKLSLYGVIYLLDEGLISGYYSVIYSFMVVCWFVRVLQLKMVILQESSSSSSSTLVLYSHIEIAKFIVFPV